MHPIRSLTSSLAASIGSSQARLELKWMKQASNNTKSLLKRRILGEPLQYILRNQPFGPLNLLTRPPVLIPRPETEHWVIKFADLLSHTTQRPKSLLDLGTGSGCIPLLLCHLCPPGTLHAHGIDISIPAIQLANDNAALCLGPAGRNTFKTSLANFLSPTFPSDPQLEPPYDIITSNPPYISWHEYLQLPRSVSDYEDPIALFGGPSGLEFYHAIARLVQHPGFLSPGAIVALEVGHSQARAVRHLMRTKANMRHTEIWHDPWGKRRTVVARAPSLPPS